ncbi:Synaptic vesicle 2-related protein [Echinococcus granulosus]|uniref:Synaptic vesicle 2-related protein n=1 Tax=Echinococcus granulosus TaxID=6210 RepID=W6UPB1_ECHGR|nr:Synaptic vesicle 2-related protein [Echinococcus granulosus]EUB62606.1 Synaptic vesicle 2-related protein [Echinococcus granulosus]
MFHCRSTFRVVQFVSIILSLKNFAKKFYAANAMEMLLLSVLGPVLRCAWQLNSSQVALITTVVFIGFFFGAPIWGLFSDRFGRKRCFVLVLSWVSYTGLATAVSPNFIWLIILRGLVGFGIGGEGSAYTLMSEFLPVKYRAKVLIGISIFWAIGSTMEIGLAFVVLPKLGWRWLVFFSAVPIVMFCFLTPMKFENCKKMSTRLSAEVYGGRQRENCMFSYLGHLNPVLTRVGALSHDRKQKGGSGGSNKENGFIESVYSFGGRTRPLGTSGHLTLNAKLQNRSRFPFTRAILFAKTIFPAHGASLCAARYVDAANFELFVLATFFSKR